MADRPIGERVFSDGATRTVFQGEEDRQYVIDDDGAPVYGLWVYLDEPVIVERGQVVPQEGMR